MPHDDGRKTMLVGQKEARPTDKTQLVQVPPSPCSTDEPSGTLMTNANDYGTSDSFMARNDSAASFELLLPREDEDGDQGLLKQMKSFLLYTCTNKRLASVGVLLVVTVLLLVLKSAPFESSGGYQGAGRQWTTPPPKGTGGTTFSTLDPVKDLGLIALTRPKESSPPDSVRRQSPRHALPTNAWYQNLLMAKGEPTSVHRVYAIPYVLDAVGPIPGLRAHPNHMIATQTVVQLSFVDSHGITLGAALNDQKNSAEQQRATDFSKQYEVISSTALAVNLEWNAFPMRASIVKGMPYATMHYLKHHIGGNTALLPTLASEVKLAAIPLADGSRKMTCSGHDAEAVRVENELKLIFHESDFTWLVFFSEPVMLKCVDRPEGAGTARTIFQVVALAEPANDNDSEELTIRAALLSNCTYGSNQIFCRRRETSSYIEKYGDLLRERAHLYPGPLADVRYDIKNDEAVLSFDWDAQTMNSSQTTPTKNHEQSQLRSESDSNDHTADQVDLIMYALPHHLDRMTMELMPWNNRFCADSLIGAICLVNGAAWDLVENLPTVSFHAPRAPRPESLLGLSKALQNDLKYELASYYERGAGDTYFSGKMLARIGRVLVIAEELESLCSAHNLQEIGYVLSDNDTESYAAACRNISLPSRDEIDTTVERLRSSVEIWINGTADIPFVYDTEWGGVISCGCNFNGETSSCDNVFPNCPSIGDTGMDFGNGFYNDHHFHYGYHIYAAAVVSHFDKEWGRKHFEQVLLLVRDIANPSGDDVFFPKCRHKDWYQGHSWASGVPLPPYLNGKNQESSSEAIAAYEAVALFGNEMMTAWKGSDEAKVQVALRIRDVGRILSSTEILSTDYYWHVRQHDESRRIYPSAYTENTVGMLWSQMAQCQTWFGNARYLAYGIQLLPLTVISETRDDPSWLREMYASFAESCDADDNCMKGGWSILQLAVLASVGHAKLARESAEKLPLEVFDTAGGNGHSLSNTLWYIATRPETEPIELPEADKRPREPSKEVLSSIDCGIPETCTDDVLNTDANGSSCRERISWLITAMGFTESHACHKVAGGEFTKRCGPCDPGVDTKTEEAAKQSTCPPCTRTECLSDLNRCPRFENSYVCMSGVNRGGCSPTPWELGTGQCDKCCEVTECGEYTNFESSEDEQSEEESNEPSSCIKCETEVCTSKINLCPMKDAPYLCIEGKNVGGCSPKPWEIDGECKRCCDLKLTCRHHN